MINRESGPPGPHALSPWQGAAAVPAQAGWPMANGPVPSPFMTGEQKAELLEYWHSITKRKWAVFALAAVVSVLAWVVASGLSPVYQASTKVLIEPGNARVLTMDDLYRGANQSRDHLQTQIEILMSRENALRTAQALKLWTYPAFDARVVQPSLLQRTKATLGMGEPAISRQWTEKELASAAADRVLGSLGATVVRSSQLVVVSFESTNPELAAKIANTTAEQFLEAERRARNLFTQGFNEQMREQLVALREKLTESERALQSYRETQMVAPVTAGKTAPSSAESQMSTALSTRLIEARTKRLELESAYQIARSRPVSELGALPEIARDGAVQEGQRAVQVATAKLKELENGSGVEFWKIERARSELADARAQLQQRQSAVVALIAQQYESARSVEQSLERSLSATQGQAKGEARQLSKDEFKLSLLEREYQTNRQFYEQFLNRTKETTVAGDMQATVGRVIDPALTPGVPAKPDKARITGTAAMVALILAALACVALDRLDNTVKGGEDAELRLRQPLLAAIPQVERVERSKVSRLFLDDPHSHFAEAIRTARTGVLLSTLDTPHKIVLITSTLPGEGKTTVAVNLALAHAQTKRTLLIDCDLRRSQVTPALSLPPGLPGLSNLVAGTAPAKQCIYAVPDTPLYVLPVGDLPPNPLELLLSQRFKDALAQLSDAFEMIIIDSPPTELVSDSLVLAPMATSTAFVVKAMSTPAPLVRKNLARLQRAGANILGVLVNQLDFKHARLYYGEYGASSYNYGGYGRGNLTYGAKPEKDKPQVNA